MTVVSINKTLPFPFLKWAGGKRRITSHILSRMPTRFNRYYEPFLGGGAVFFELSRQKRFESASLGDCNGELTNTYSVVRDDIDSLIHELKTDNYAYNKTNYLRIRALLPTNLSEIKRAARFIYLNKTCFNGLYRVNKSGQFNVPFGRYNDPLICDETNLRAVSGVLEKVRIQKIDFEQCVIGAREGDVVYIDPPYMPSSKTSKFTSYSADGFTEDDHNRLATCFEKLIERKVCCVLSNSFTPMTMDLYRKYDILEIMGSRVIGGPAAYRKAAKEIIVSGGWNSS